MLELQKVIMIEVTQILKNKLCMFSFFLFYWLFGSFKLCTPILLTFWAPIFSPHRCHLPTKGNKSKQASKKKGKQKENTKQKNHFASSPFSLPLQHLFVHSGGIGGFSVPHSIYFFVPSVLLGNVHCNELLFSFKAFSFWYTINTKSSSKLLWNVLWLSLGDLSGIPRAWIQGSWLQRWVAPGTWTDQLGYLLGPQPGIGLTNPSTYPI